MNEERLRQLRKTPRCGDGSILLDTTPGLMDLLDEARPATVLTLGADQGVGTEVFLLYCEHVTVVDPWASHDRYDHSDRSRRFRAFHERTKSYSNLTIIRGYSPEALSIFKPASFDMVYIDAVHAYDPVLDDILASFPLVKVGGWMAGHDYWFPDNAHNIVEAVDYMFGKPKVFSDGSWLVPRPDALPERPPRREPPSSPPISPPQRLPTSPSPSLQRRRLSRNAKA